MSGVPAIGTCVYEFVNGEWVLQPSGPTNPTGCNSTIEVSISIGTTITVNCSTGLIISFHLGGQIVPSGGTIIKLKANAQGQWVKANGDVWTGSIGTVSGKQLIGPPGAGIDLELTPGADFKYKVVGLSWPQQN